MKTLNSLRIALRQLGAGRIAVTMNEDDSMEIIFFAVPSYQQGTQILRQFGIGDRDKNICNMSNGEFFTDLKGKIGQDKIRAFIDGIPPSCRIEAYTEKIPKEQTVTTDEFIEVKRTKVVCSK